MLLFTTKLITPVYFIGFFDYFIDKKKDLCTFDMLLTY